MDDIINGLRNSGYRITTSRKNLIEMFYYNQSKHFSYEEIINYLLTKESKVNKMSVYNNLKIFLKEGIIKESIFHGNKIYEFNELNHSHFYCRNCNKQIDIDYEKLYNLNGEVEKKYDIKIDSTKIEFFGLCQDCKGKND